MPPEVEDGRFGVDLALQPEPSASTSPSCAKEYESSYVFEDKPIKVPWVVDDGRVKFNVRYEQEYKVPRYSRDMGVQEQVDMLVSKRRPFDSGYAKQIGRSNTRCFNCDSYGHTVRECWKQRDRDDASRPTRQVVQEEAGGARYFDGDTIGGISEVIEYIPGNLKPKTRKALGLGPDDPPPWLYKMQQMGLPPTYSQHNAQVLGALRQPQQPPPPPSFPPRFSITSMNEHENHGGQMEYEEGEYRPGVQPVHKHAGEAECGTLDADNFIEMTVHRSDESIQRQHNDMYYFPGVNAPPPPQSNPTAWGQKPKPMVSLYRPPF